MVAVGLRVGAPPALQHRGQQGPIVVRLTVDRERCIGCGTCVELRPEMFAIGKDKVASVMHADLAATEQACAAEAAEECPHLAIVEVGE